jgi:hypothetical protein
MKENNEYNNKTRTTVPQVHFLPFIVVFVVLVPLAPFLPFIVVFFLGDLLYKTIGYALFLVRFICFKHQHEYIEGNTFVVSSYDLFLILIALP